MPSKKASKRKYQNNIKEEEVTEVTHPDTAAVTSKLRKIASYENMMEEEEVTEVTDLDTNAIDSSGPSDASLEQDQEISNSSEAYPNLSDFMKCSPIKSNKAVMSLEHEGKFYFKGKLLIKVLKGMLEVMGYKLTAQEQKFLPVYSPSGCSLISCQGFKDANDDEVDISSDLLREGVPKKSEVVTGDCVFVVKKMDEAWCQFLSEHMKKTKNKINLLNRDFKLPQEEVNEGGLADVEKNLSVNLFSVGFSPYRLFETGENWELGLQSVQVSLNNNTVPRLVVAGGKGVGKSTFTRWLINRLVSKTPVVLLDLDPGQAEMTLSGYCSVSLVTTPLLGPNFTHVGSQHTQLQCFLGDNNVGNCANRFIKILHFLSDYINTNLSQYPLIVNTMGWCQGMGLMLLVDTIRHIQPSTVIQLQSRFPRKNFPYSLTPDTVSSSRDSWRSVKTKLVYNLLELSAVPEQSAKNMRSQVNWGLPDPKKLRDIVVLSWLGRTGWPWPVYKIPLSSLTLGSINHKLPPGNMLAAINSTLVDLCHVSEQEIVRPDKSELYSVLARRDVRKRSIGVGFVRNIDMENHLIFLSTTVSPDSLNSVNCLMMGQLQVPDCVLLKNVDNTAPYVGKETNNPLDASWQRYSKPRGNNCRN